MMPSFQPPVSYSEKSFHFNAYVFHNGSYITYAAPFSVIENHRLPQADQIYPPEPLGAQATHARVYARCQASL